MRNFTRLLRELNRLNGLGIAWATYVRGNILKWMVRALILIGIEFMLNLWGYKEINLFFAAPMALAVFWVSTNPRGIIYLAEGAWLWGALKIGISTDAAVKKAFQIVGGAILEFLTGFAIISLWLGMIAFGENWFAFPLLASILLTGYLIQKALGKKTKMFLNISWYLVWVAGIGIVWSLFHADIQMGIVKATGHDIVGWFDYNPAVQTAAKLLQKNKEARQKKANRKLIDDLSAKAERGELTEEEEANLERLLRENSLWEAVGGLTRQPFVVEVPISATDIPVPMPPKAQGRYRIKVPALQVSYTCDPGTPGSGTLLPAGSVDQTGSEGELLLNGNVFPWGVITLDGSPVTARLAWASGLQCRTGIPVIPPGRKMFVNFVPAP